MHSEVLPVARYPHADRIKEVICERARAAEFIIYPGEIERARLKCFDIHDEKFAIGLQEARILFALMNL